MLCQHCGHWNDSKERRCEHCGRHIETSAGTLPSRRMGLDRDEPPVVPLPAKGAKLPPPAPEWKQQLDQKLESYRERRSQSGLHDKPILAAQAAAAGSNRPTIVPFSRATGQIDKPLSSGASDRRSPLSWRKVERSTSATSLPPLRKTPARAADTTGTLAERVQPERPATPSPRAARITVRAMAGILDVTLILVALGVFFGVFHAVGDLLHLDAVAVTLQWLVTEPVGVRAMVFVLFTLMSFYWLFYVRFIGETPGMTWVGLRIVSFDGASPSPSQLWTRAFGTVLSTAAAGLGFAWSVADEEQLTWHDRISKTLILQEESGIEPSGSAASAAVPARSR